jgi:hypothetical protein
MALADVVSVVGVLGVVVVHTLVAAVVVRFFRLRLATQWGWVVYSLLAVPLVYLVSALVFLGVLGVGQSLTVDRGTLLALVWGLPFALGVSLDLFWVPQPEEVEAGQRP